MFSQRPWRAAIALVAALAMCVSSAFAAPSVSEMAAEVGLSAQELSQVEKGEMVETTPTDRSDRELSIGIVFLVRATPREVMQAFERATDLKADPHVIVVHEVSGPGTLGDFEELRLMPHGKSEAERYLAATPGDELNLSTAEIAGFRQLGEARQEDVEAQLRTILLARYQAYRAQGIDGIAPYDRGDGVQRNLAEDLRQHSAAKILGKYSPAFREVLQQYPTAHPQSLEERFYWLVYERDDRPTLTLHHRIALPLENGFVVADREFYVSQGHNTSQAHAAFLPDGDATMVFYVTRVSTDRASGFGASAKHAIGHHLISHEMQIIFDRMRAAFATH